MRTRPPFDTYPQLRNSAIVLREPVPGDLERLVPISFYDGIKAAGTAEAQAMLRQIAQDYEAGNSIHWIVAHRDTNLVLGTCGYYRGFVQQAGELGCILHPDSYGKGYMSMALAAAIAFGYSSMKLERIVAITSIENTAALHLLQRLRFEEMEKRGDGMLLFEHKLAENRGR